MNTRQRIRNLGLAIASTLALLIASAPLHATEILIFGDSWGEPMVHALDTVFNANGHTDVTVEVTPFWGLAARLSSSEGLNFITEELNQRPDVDIVHLSIGINDLHCLLVNSSCNINWNPTMAGTQAEADILATIMADVETIVDHIIAIRPDIKIFWAGGDYTRPRVPLEQFGSPAEHNTLHNKEAELAQQLASNKPELTFLMLPGLLQVTYGFDGIQYTPWDPSSPIPPGDPSLPDANLPSPDAAFYRTNNVHPTRAGYEVWAGGYYDGYYKAALAGRTFQINPGLNDAWFNPATPGQGFLISVFPETERMFLAWFTFDTERPPEDVTAHLGEPGHRWLTAQGTYDGDSADLTIFMTEGGVFDAAEPSASADPDGDGSILLEFADCTEGLVNYEITSLGISGEIPIQRIALDNVPLCESLNEQLQQLQD